MIETESSRLVQSAKSDLKSDLNPDLTRDLDKLIESFHQLELEVNQYIPSLPSYHVKSLTNQLKSLSDGIESAKEIIVPKKKFSFGRRDKGSSSGACSVSEVVKSPPEEKETPDNEENSITIRKKRKHNLTLSHAVSDSRVIMLEDLVDCTISLPGNPSTVFVKMIKNSLLNIGPVKSSVFISDAIDSTFNACAQQVRVHDSTNCVLRLKVTGGAILENCSNIQVGRYNYLYPELDADLAKVDMVDETKNKWDQIVDFNWLAGDAKSPNWDFLKDD